jgi:hypothetical protein
MKSNNTNQPLNQNHRTISIRHIPIIVTGLLFLTTSCISQTTSCRSGQPVVLNRTKANEIIYVSDFQLQSSGFKQDKGGITGKGYLVPAPPKSFLRRKHQDPDTAAHNFIDLMSESLVRDFRKAGFQAKRLPSTENKPKEGLLLSGVFTELNEGSQMRRALLGFGAGKAKVKMSVIVADLSCADEGLYEADVANSNGKRPGAAIATNPYTGAAGFVVKFGMTKNAPEKMVKQAASKVATELTKQLKSESTVAQVQQAANHSGPTEAAR